MTREEVLKRLCETTTRVARHLSPGHHLAADCFCEQSAPIQADALAFFALLGMGDYRFDERVLTFIDAAVTTALEHHQPERSNRCRSTRSRRKSRTNSSPTARS